MFHKAIFADISVSKRKMGKDIFIGWKLSLPVSGIFGRKASSISVKEVCFFFYFNVPILSH